MKKLYYLNILFSLLFLVGYNSSKAQESSSNGAVFNHLLEIIEPAPSSDVSKVDVQAVLINLRNAYEQNQLDPELRLKLYKSILNRTDVKKWPVELKAIVLYKLIDYDTKNKIPAYKIADEGRSPFFNIINQLIEEEFTFVTDLKQSLADKINQQNKEANEPGKAPALISKEDIELSEEQQIEVVNIAYRNLAAKVQNLDSYHF